MKNLAIERLGAFIILVHNRETPLTADWNVLLNIEPELEAATGGDISQSSSLIFTDGGAPNAAQRHLFSERLHGRRAPSVVITDNLMVRAITSLVSLFNKGITVYGATEWRRAFVHAGVPEGRYAEFLHVARRLAVEVGGCQVLNSIEL